MTFKNVKNLSFVRIFPFNMYVAINRVSSTPFDPVMSVVELKQLIRVYIAAMYKQEIICYAKALGHTKSCLCYSIIAICS